MTEVEALIQLIEDARDHLLHAVDGLTEAQAAFKPAPDQWSIVEVVEHLYLAELSGVAKIWAAREALRAGRGWHDARPNAGQHIESIIDATWQPREVAPPIATPHIGGPLAFWIACTRSLTPILAALGAQLEDVALDEIVFPHFLSGPLDGRQRLEFLRYHIERHLKQIDAIRATSGFRA
jgi:hypothetical protein